MKKNKIRRLNTLHLFLKARNNFSVDSIYKIYKDNDAISNNII
jgi:hypothetical protein